MSQQQPQLGLGLISIGRSWGARPVPALDADQAHEFLAAAYALGLRCFDTAPSYGDSEGKLGRFLRELNREQRGLVTVATKFGEHWDAEHGRPFIDHSYDALCRSLDQSIQRLGSIDLLQLHRTTPELLRSPEVARGWEFALKAGIKQIGVSASNPDSATAALDLGYGVIQMPYNLARMDMAPAFRTAAARGVQLLINRPFQAGELLYETPPPGEQALFAHVLRVSFNGWVLTGTRSIDHLRANIAAFRAALETSN